MARRQAGVSLVETMVGITVGLITVLLITQIMSSFQASRNSISFGADAQENGLFALQIIATDVREAGAGYYSSPATTQTSAASCSNVCTFDGTRAGTTGWCSNPAHTVSGTGTGTVGQAIPSMSGKSMTPNGTAIPLVPLAPVLIEKYAACCNTTPTGFAASYAGNSDVITVRTAARLSGAVPTSTPTGATLSNTADTIGVARAFGFNPNDLALIANGYGTDCALIQVTNTAPVTSPLAHAAATNKFNPSDPSLWPSFDSSAQIFNIGNSSTPKGAIVAREYSIPCIAATGSGTNCRGSTLQLRRMDFDATNTIVPDVMADGIVALRAQYGIASQNNTLAVNLCTTTNNVTTCVGNWIGTDHASWATTWDPSVMTTASMQLIRAVRLFVVARSGNREAGIVTQACGTIGYTLGPCPSGGATQSDTTMPAIKLAVSDTDTEWQHYRYKVYTSVIPMRNVLWNLQ